MSPEKRMFDSNGARIMVEDLPNGEFLVVVKYGAVWMSIAVSPEVVAVLFPERSA